RCVRDIAEMTLANEITPESSCQEIYSIYRSLDYAGELSTWAYLCDDFEYMVPAGTTLQEAVKEEAREFLSTPTSSKIISSNAPTVLNKLLNTLRDYLRLPLRKSSD